MNTTPPRQNYPTSPTSPPEVIRIRTAPAVSRAAYAYAGDAECSPLIPRTLFGANLGRQRVYAIDNFSDLSISDQS